MHNEVSTISDLKPGQRFNNVLTGQLVTLKSMSLIGDAAEVIYTDDTGTLHEEIVTDTDIRQWQLMPEDSPSNQFDGDARGFLLSLEALRIQNAALYDPMTAVHSSTVDPLPHQIRAVYQDLLPKVPLRFLLADDPGAGKTIMAGLYLKEMILRSNCDRAIIVAPGGLVEQWCEELKDKFNLDFAVFNPQVADTATSENPFDDHPYLIARMDQLARNEELTEQLKSTYWDIAIVDEAHRMSATYNIWSGQTDETKRFRLGRILSNTAHNFLLMTATPHSGNNDNFQAFMSLLDRDQFEGPARNNSVASTSRLMRRMVKEELLTFDGKPLFPERHAYTVSYSLSPLEHKLYDEVTHYVRKEMNRAARMNEQKRGNTVGFALTVLQRRLASSPNAILSSLQRRHARLQESLSEMNQIAGTQIPHWAKINHSHRLSLWDDPDVTAEELTELEAEVDAVVDSATAARTVPELQAEISHIEQLIHLADRVHRAGNDQKWVHLKGILNDEILRKTDGEIRKIIVFTEHKDTLDYLHNKITELFRSDNAVLTIHGGISRHERKQIREDFTHDPSCIVLLATDAAGEGLNLQRAHLMVNYDLPWNPNRIEQRFGRIHRIGQQEVCHLWNMIATGTREGEVFERLLAKIQQMGEAYSGKLFNVLGDGAAFADKPLRELLLDAIRYGDQPEVKAKLDQVIDDSVRNGIEELMSTNALDPSMSATATLEEARVEMEKAQARRLQPGYIEAFFIQAFSELGGQIRKRETGRWEITRVPSIVITQARQSHHRQPISRRYERITFDQQHLRPISEGRILPAAELIAPGHPLLEATSELIIEKFHGDLSQGTILIDNRDDQLDYPAILHVVEQRITTQDARKDTVAHYFDYVLVSEPDADCQFSLPAGHKARRHLRFESSDTPVFLELDAPRASELELIKQVPSAARPQGNYSKDVQAHTLSHQLKDKKTRLSAIRKYTAEKAAAEIKKRLKQEIVHWNQTSAELELKERDGKYGRIKSADARAKAKDLNQRMHKRVSELAGFERLAITPPRVRAKALVIPSAFLAHRSAESSDGESRTRYAKNTKEVERRAVDLVLDTERRRGNTPEEMAFNNPGYDIQSRNPAGKLRYIEVKGRIAGSRSFTITRNEILFARTHPADHILALVEVSPDGPDRDRIVYINNAFSHLDPSDSTESQNEMWGQYWSRGGAPLNN
ncbi:helicase-related protein [Corynebacterium pseudodiphtheriticum]|uniref:helicase-related protein n=1 Tax=Corynebacterium pseudodiphtheriticum TaxID=37637 RepID=UPI0025509201|nr:helicase-related protein [Corynebacterium pseudodiphtheriticum]MDK8685183.1 helicase-related protein [Corynebacterium pseudodiphtheriticum]